VDEAIGLGYNLIIAHHPLIFKPIKRINSQHEAERCIVKAIKHDIAIYAAHTNLDNAPQGVNAMICEKLGLTQTKILEPAGEMLRKVIVFVPLEHAQKVRNAMFDAGAGRLGDYSSCSFNIPGQGTFKAGNDAKPYVGAIGEIHTEKELKIEALCEKHNLSRILKAMIQAHPYEEVAYDVYPLVNKNPYVGSGMIGEMDQPIDEMDFLHFVKQVFGPGCLKHSPLVRKKISKVAVCGGSGNFLIPNALSAGADAFITGEIKYHDYFMAENKILLIEAGHYETEQFTKDLLYQVVKENFTTFATRISIITTNPVNYL
jgi:dinuclear metal center YbgI/SA1388 family protein